MEGKLRAEESTDGMIQEAKDNLIEYGSDPTDAAEEYRKELRKNLELIKKTDPSSFKDAFSKVSYFKTMKNKDKLFKFLADSHQQLVKVKISDPQSAKGVQIEKMLQTFKELMEELDEEYSSALSQSKTKTSSSEQSQIDSVYETMANLNAALETVSIMKISKF